jgi:hypothetical protein
LQRDLQKGAVAMKIVILTDIHDDEEAAKAAVAVEKPDAVLDCGDHHRITGLFDFTPHLCIFGNHVPEEFHINEDSLPFPIKVGPGRIYNIFSGNENVRVSGLDGHYSKRHPKNAVRNCDIEDLHYIPEKGLDVLLLHESPLNALAIDDGKMLAQKVLNEIYRIEPAYVFAGHSNNYSENSLRGVKFIELDNVGKGYGILKLENAVFSFERKRSVFSNGRRIN